MSACIPRVERWGWGIKRGLSVTFERSNPSARSMMLGMEASYGALKQSPYNPFRFRMLVCHV